MKARRDSIGHVVLDGAYSSFYDAIVTGMAPNLLLLAYGSQTRRVIDLFAVHRSLLTPLALFKRKELPPTARRAGWVGCNLLLDSLPEGAVIPVVQRGHQIERQVISAAWDRYRFLDHSAISDKGWTADVLSCLKKLPNRIFTLADAYRFEGDLQPLHPSNRNVRPKIRQQLQVLVAHGLLNRISAGVYRLSG